VHARLKSQLEALCYLHTETYQITSRPICLLHTSNVHITSLCTATTFLLAAPALHQLCHVLRLLAPGRMGFTSTSLCAVTTRIRPHALYVNLAVRRDYSSPDARALCQPRRAPRELISTLPAAATTSPTPRVRVPRHVTRLRGSLRCSSSTTPPCAGSLSTTSPPPSVRVPRHVGRPVTRLVAPLVVEYSASRRLVIDYFASAARPGASARRAARHAARRAARRRLLHLAPARRRLLRLRRASGCLGTSRGSSRGSSRHSSSTSPPRAGSSSTTSPPPRVRVSRHVARLVRRLVASLVVDYSASRRLVVDYSVSPLAVDYFAYAACPGASARRAACHTARRRLLRALRLRLAATLALLQTCLAS
jgi:hypothetical protein